MRLCNLSSFVIAIFMALTTQKALSEPDYRYKLQVAHYSYALSDLATIIAQEKGFFDKNRIDVELTSFRNAAEAAAALYGGSLDIIPSNGINQLLSNQVNPESEKHLVQVFGFQSVGNWSLVLSPELNGKFMDELSALRLLKGKVVGTPGPGTDGHRFTELLLKRAGLKANTDVTLLKVGLGPEGVSAFKFGQIDAMIAMQPVTALLQDAGGSVAWDQSQDKELQSWPFTVYLTVRSKAKELEKPLVAWQKAMNDAVQFILDTDNTEQVEEIWKQYNQALSPEVIKSSLLSARSTITGQVDCNAIENAVKIGREFSLIQGEIPSCSSLIWGKSTDKITSRTQ